MKRTISLAMALLMCLAVGSITVASAKPAADVKTKVTLKYESPDPGDPYGRYQFEGTVKAKKGCAAKRKVNIKGAGKTTTSKSGKFEITLNAEPAPGAFTAKVKASKVKKGDDTINCAAGESKSVTAP